MNNQSLTIKCPHCGKEISIQDALSHQIRKTISEETREQAKKEFLHKMEYLEEQNKEKEVKLDEALKNELEVRKERNRLNEEKNRFELEKQRQIDLEREKIRELTTKEILEDQHLKMAEKDKKIEGLHKEIMNLQQKAAQGSQQIQGEVLELDLEKELREAFPNDEIHEIKKGERGADIKQLVKTPKGTYCGLILWESKRQKTWKQEYIDKLKEDLREIKDGVPVIVTTVMPKDSNGLIFYKEGVWVCSFSYMTVLAELIRQRLIEVARQKFINKNQGTKAEGLYEYIMSYEFRQQVEAIVEAYDAMKIELIKEKKAFEAIWKNREEQMEKLMKGTARIVGSISGKVGSEFPQLKGLELLESGDKNVSYEG